MREVERIEYHGAEIIVGHFPDDPPPNHCVYVVSDYFSLMYTVINVADDEIRGVVWDCKIDILVAMYGSWAAAIIILLVATLGVLFLPA